MPRRARLAAAFVVFATLFLIYHFGLRKSRTPADDLLKDATFRRTIVAVGDIHSYLPNALKVLTFANVIDKNAKWTGAADYLVQTGDLVDRGGDTLKVYALFEKLREEANSKGGSVVSHFGNHEFMNLIGDWRYVYSSDLATFSSVGARQKAFSSMGVIGRALAANYSVTSRVPLHPLAGDSPLQDYIENESSRVALSHAAISFVHGGIHPSLKFLTPYPSRINDVGRTLLTRLDRRDPLPPPHPPAPYPGLPLDSSEEEQELYGANGPLWFRGWAQEPESKEFCLAADALMKRIGVRRLVMGHTPNFEHIVSRCEGKVVIIDTGITPAYGGVLSALRIEYGLIPIHDMAPLVQGTLSSAQRKERWKEVEILTALYEGRQERLVHTERVIET